MAMRHLARNVFRYFKTSAVDIQRNAFTLPTVRCFSSTRMNETIYRDLESFLHKEIQLERSVQKHPHTLPMIDNFEISSNGPEVTLMNKIRDNEVIIKFNVVNSLNANDLDRDENLNPYPQDPQSTTQLKARPNFRVEINRSGQILLFMCSFLPTDTAEGIYQKSESGEEQNDAKDKFEDFQIDEFTIHDGELSERIYSSDCSVIDGELYDKLLHLLEEHGIGENFANQLADFATAYEHRQYINLLERLKHFVKD